MKTTGKSISVNERLKAVAQEVASKLCQNLNVLLKAFGIQIRLKCNCALSISIWVAITDIGDEWGLYHW